MNTKSIVFHYNKNTLQKVLLLFFIFSLSFFIIMQNFALAENNKNTKPNLIPGTEFTTVIFVWEDEERPVDANIRHAYAGTNTKKGGTYLTASVGTYDNFNIFAPRGKPTSEVWKTYETLGTGLPGDNTIMRGIVADGFDLSKDRKKLRIRIDARAHFSDGSKITSDDIVYTFNALMTEASPTYSFSYQDVTKIYAESESVVVFEFAEHCSKYLPFQVLYLPVLSKKWWEGKNMGQPQKEPFLGSGRYIITGYDFNKNVILERDDNYWGKDKPISEGAGNFDKLIVEYYRDTTIAREVFFAGDSHYYSEKSMKDWEFAYDTKSVREGKIRREELSFITGVGMLGLAMNMRKPIFQDKNVRNALMLLMDFEWLNRTMYYDTYVRTPSYFSGYKFAAKEYPSEKEIAILNEYKDRIDPAVFGALPEIPVSDASGEMRQQMKQAVELFKKAGWELKGGKMINDKGEQFKITLIANSATVQRTYAQYVQTLALIGVDLVIQVLDQNMYTNKVKEYDYELCYVTYRQLPTPGSELRAAFGSEAADTFGARNYIGIKDPVIDELIERLIGVQTQEEMQLYASVIDRILLHGMYVVPGWYSPLTRVAWWESQITSPVQLDKTNISGIYMYWHMGDENEL